MTFEHFKGFCLDLAGTTLDYPFGNQTTVFRLERKIFALCSPQRQPLSVNLKGDPALNRDLRVSYPEILPGWHMNKEHWNTIVLEGSLEDAFIESLVRHSYALVSAKPSALRKHHRNSLPN